MKPIHKPSGGKVFVPGRVNFLGEHLDYNGGSVLPFTIHLGLMAKWEASGDDRVSVHSEGISAGWTSRLSELNDVQHVPSWYRPFAAMLCVIRKKLGNDVKRGFSLQIRSTLPPASGLSSSAAVEILAGWVLLRANDLEPDRRLLAFSAQEAEHQHLGVHCGIMDMWAIAHGKRDFLTAIDCRGPTHEHIPFNTGPWRVLVLDSGLPRTLAGSAYNDRRAACERALAALRRHWPRLNHLAEAELEMLEAISDPVDRRRARHVVMEMDRVRKAITLLQNQNIEETGALLNASHASLRDDYEVTGEGLDFLAAEAQKQKGCIGCRMTGAGFGGCLLAIVHEVHVPAFLKHFENLRENWQGKSLRVIPVQSDEIREIS